MVGSFFDAAKEIKAAWAGRVCGPLAWILAALSRIEYNGLPIIYGAVRIIRRASLGCVVKVAPECPGQLLPTYKATLGSARITNAMSANL